MLHQERNNAVQVGHSTDSRYNHCNTLSLSLSLSLGSQELEQTLSEFQRKRIEWQDTASQLQSEMEKLQTAHDSVKGLMKVACVSESVNLFYLFTFSGTTRSFETSRRSRNFCRGITQIYNNRNLEKPFLPSMTLHQERIRRLESDVHRLQAEVDNLTQQRDKLRTDMATAEVGCIYIYHRIVSLRPQPCFKFSSHDLKLSDNRWRLMQ